MRSLFFIPILALSLTLIACGKKKDDGQGPIVGGPVITNPIPPINIPGGSGDFFQFCQSYGGSIISLNSQTVCQYQFGAGGGSGYQTYCSIGNTNAGWFSGIELAPYDTVTVSASGRPDILIGSSKIEYTSTFVSPGYGSLRFTNDNSCDDFFQVNSISVKRCVNSYSQTMQCP